jgi:hypothetical protein
MPFNEQTEKTEKTEKQYAIFLHDHIGFDLTSIGVNGSRNFAYYFTDEQLKLNLMRFRINGLL